MSVPKELDFFIVPDEELFPVGNWSRGLDWYRSHFTERTPVRGETSPNYTVYPFAEDVAERAASVVPDAKIIYLVRDPIDRIVSHYLHRVGQGEERRSLDDALGDIDGEGPGMTLVYRSMYFMQIERWTRCFPDSSVLVLAQEDLQAERAETLVRVFCFLGVDRSFSHEGFQARSNVSMRSVRPHARRHGSGASAGAPPRGRCRRGFAGAPRRCSTPSVDPKQSAVRSSPTPGASSSRACCARTPTGFALLRAALFRRGRCEPRGEGMPHAARNQPSLARAVALASR